MKINELQIGNWVYESESTQFPMFVTGILKDSDGNGGEVYLEFEGNEGDIWEVNIEDARPIPITEDILANNGFEKHTSYWNESHNYFKLPDKRFVLLSVMNGDEILYRLRGMGINIKYVHELQNAMRMAGIEWEVQCRKGEQEN